MFIKHLKKQAKRTHKRLFPDYDLVSEKERLQATLSGTLSDIERDFGLMGVMTIRGLYFRFTAESMLKSYGAEGLDFEAFSKSLSYGVLADKVFPVRTNSVVSVGPHIAYLIMGRIAKQSDWIDYALPRLRSFQSMQSENMQSLLLQFPMLEFICDESPTAEKAHKFMMQSYNIDSAVNPDLAYLAVTEDHIKYTKLYKDVYTSIYASEPLNFLPLEILYLSQFIELPIEDELVGIRERLKTLPLIKDDAMLALEAFVESSAG